MKIHFDNVSIDGTGPGTFANRLARALFESGHEVVFTCSGADVSLVFIERSGDQLAKKVVQRLDGIWFKPDEFAIKNVGIRSLYEKADGVIWQSRFDACMSIKHFGLRGGVCAIPEYATDRIINNGVEIKPVKTFSIPKLAELASRYEKIYVCSSNWHTQKRLEANVRLFERLRLKHPNSCLIIMGKHPDYRASGQHIFYTGHVDHDVCNEIYSAADWMLHLSWADHCPNVVIEALAQATPIVCTEVGGTKELIGTYGVVLKEQAYCFELADYDNPPYIDVAQIDDLPDRSTLDYTSIADIDIVNVARRYVDCFKAVMTNNTTLI